MDAPQLLGLGGRILFLILQAAVLLLHGLGLPANWILLGLAVLFAVLTDMRYIGWIGLGIMASLAVLAEVLENVVGLVYASRKGATRAGLLGAFVGGLACAILLASVVPPFGSMLGAFAGSFLGAVLFEFVREQKMDRALRAGHAAFVGKVLAAVLKTTCGFWMWSLLAYRLLAPR